MLPLPPILRDDPPGTALSVGIAGKIVISSVKGIPYLLDVLERGPLALVVHDDVQQVSDAFEHLTLQGDEFLYLGPQLQYSPLTSCERRVLQMIAFGLSNAEMAGRIGRKTSTVNTQVSSILAKLGVPSRHAARSLYWGYPLPPTNLDNYG